MLFILALTPLVVLFGMLLTFALLTAHRDPDKAEAEAIIRATGEWCPFRRRRDTHRLPGRDDE